MLSGEYSRESQGERASARHRRQGCAGHRLQARYSPALRRRRQPR